MQDQKPQIEWLRRLGLEPEDVAFNNHLMESPNAIGIPYQDHNGAAYIGAELMQLITLNDIVRYAARQESPLADI